MSKKEQEKSEKLAKLKASGLGSQAKGLIETLVEDALAKETFDNIEKEMEIIDILKDEKIKKKVETIIEKKIKEFREDKEDAAMKQKSEKVQTDEFWDAVTKFDPKQLATEYQNTLNQLSSLYKRRTLVNILANGDLDRLHYRTQARSSN